MAPSCSSKVAETRSPRKMKVEIEDFPHPTYVLPRVLDSILLIEGSSWF